MRRENVGFAAFDIVMSNGWLMLTEVTSMNLKVIVCNRNSCTLCSVIALIEGGCEVDICNAKTHLNLMLYLICIWSCMLYLYCMIYRAYYTLNILCTWYTWCRGGRPRRDTFIRHNKDLILRDQLFDNLALPLRHYHNHVCCEGSLSCYSVISLNLCHVRFSFWSTQPFLSLEGTMEEGLNAC